MLNSDVEFCLSLGVLLINAYPDSQYFRHHISKLYRMAVQWKPMKICIVFLSFLNRTLHSYAIHHDKKNFNLHVPRDTDRREYYIAKWKYSSTVFPSFFKLPFSILSGDFNLSFGTFRVFRLTEFYFVACVLIIVTFCTNFPTQFLSMPFSPLSKHFFSEKYNFEETNEANRIAATNAQACNPIRNHGFRDTDSRRQLLVDSAGTTC